MNKRAVAQIDTFKINWAAGFTIILIVLFVGCKPLLCTRVSSPSSDTTDAEKEKPSADYRKIPPYFIENMGQVDSTVRYYVKGPYGTVYLTPQEAVFDFLKEAERKEGDEALDSEGREGEDSEPGKKEEDKVYKRLVFRFSFKGANRLPEVVGQKELPGKVNYFVGPKSDWHSNIPTFEEVVYRDIYEGMDARFYFKGGDFRQAFVVKPGADPARIVREYEGIDSLRIKPSGELVVITSFGGFVKKSPRVFQVIGGNEVERKGEYKLLGDKSVSYDIGSYDSNLPLLIE